MSRSRRVALSLLLFSLIVPAASRATVLLEMDIEAMARRAQVVAVARVESVEARWEDDRAMIATYTRLRVEERIAGSSPERVEVRVIGGTVDGVSAIVDGGAQFRSGDRVLVFLEPRRSRSDQWIVSGAFQGAFRLEREPDTGMDIAVRPVARGVAIVGGEPEELRLYVDEVAARVRLARGER